MMLFGLCNAPSTFHTTMNSIFWIFLCKLLSFLWWYTNIQWELEWPYFAYPCCLRGAEKREGFFYYYFFIKPSKCTFGQHEEENLVANSFSRQSRSPELQAISYPQLKLWIELKEANRTDPFMRTLMDHVQNGQKKKISTTSEMGVILQGQNHCLTGFTLQTSSPQRVP